MSNRRFLTPRSYAPQAHRRAQVPYRCPAIPRALRVPGVRLHYCSPGGTHRSRAAERGWDADDHLTPEPSPNQGSDAPSYLHGGGDRTRRVHLRIRARLTPMTNEHRPAASPRLILGIETSCDETAAAVVEDGRRLRSNVIASQFHLHAQYGGVVPEVASRGWLARCSSASTPRRRWPTRTTCRCSVSTISRRTSTPTGSRSRVANTACPSCPPSASSSPAATPT